MADLRLHIRPRLGSAMTLVSDGIVPMAECAVARRRGPVDSVGAGLIGHAEPENAIAVGADPEVAARSHEHTTLGMSRRRAEVDPDIPTTTREPVRPALQLVPLDHPNRIGREVPRESSVSETETVATAGRAALLTAATKALNRRLQTASGISNSETSNRLPDHAAPLREDSATPPYSVRVTPDSLNSIPPAARLSGASLASLERPRTSSAEIANSSLPNAGSRHSANPANVRHRPDVASNHAVSSPISGGADVAGIRPTQDPKDKIAQLLMPVLPAIVPEFANQDPEAETDFEFEMRVRAALEKILSQDLLRHGFIAPEVL